jgi:hypothetical protein
VRQWVEGVARDHRAQDLVDERSGYPGRGWEEERRHEQRGDGPQADRSAEAVMELRRCRAPERRRGRLKVQPADELLEAARRFGFEVELR